MAWAATISAIASAVAALVALGITYRFAKQQNKIQEQQLKQDLFDRRYAVFVAVDVFLCDVIKADGSIKLPGEEYGRFHDAKEQAGFLFSSDVISYLDEVHKIVMDLHPIVVKRDHLAGMSQQDPDLIAPFFELMKQVIACREKRATVFRPYLQLG